MRNLKPLTFLALTLLSMPLRAAESNQQPPIHVEPPVYVTAIELVVDVRDSHGKLPPGLTRDDFVLLEDGVEKKVIGIDYLRAAVAPPQTPISPAASTQSATAPSAEPRLWQILLYFDLNLSNATNSYWSAKAFIDHVDELVKRGAVDVVVASPAPASLLHNSRDPKAVVAALKGVIARRGSNAVSWQRQAFQREKSEWTPLTVQQETTAARSAVSRARMHVEQEIIAIRQFSTNLSNWLSRYGKHMPRALFVVADGFDLDPVEYYAAELDVANQTELRTNFPRSELDSSMQHLSDLMAAGGWTTFGVLGNPFTSGWLNDPSTSSAGRVRSFARGNVAPTAGAKAYFLAPQAPLQIMSATTGGQLVANVSALSGALKDLDDRILLTYQVARAPDGAARRIVIRSRRPGLTVRTTQWASSSTPDEIAAARALQTLRNDETSGDLRVQGWFDRDADGRRGILRLAVKADALKPILPANNATTFLVTIGVDVGSQRTWIVHRRAEPDDLADGVFDYRLRLDLPPEARRIVVDVEEATSGMWGTAVVALH